MSHHEAIVIGAGQAGLAAAGALRAAGIAPVVLKAGEDTAGSWPHCYDSLTLFSPARYSAVPGLPFPGDPNRYPHRDEVADYLRRYADRLDADIRTRHRVGQVTGTDGGSWVRRIQSPKKPPSTRMPIPRAIRTIGNTMCPHRLWPWATGRRVAKTRPAAHHTATRARKTAT